MITKSFASIGLALLTLLTLESAPPVPALSQTASATPLFTLVPTLTPTAAAKVDLAKLARSIDAYLQTQNFVPGTTRQGSVYVEDLTSGQSITINAHVTYSGVSMMKIIVLMALYRKLETSPTAAQAVLIARMMICSDNAASNALIKIIGDGSVDKGLRYMTDMLHLLGLTHLILGRPFEDVNPNGSNVSRDPLDADADTYNRAIPDDLGKLTAALYPCARDGSGPLAQFGGALTIAECREMLHVMRADHLGALIDAGVPTSIPVAQKQGWDGETHGDVALITTPGGDYVLAIILHQRTWLSHLGSFPAMAEISRMVYNAYNPTHTLNAIHPQPIPVECPLDPALLSSLQNTDAPPIR